MNKPAAVLVDGYPIDYSILPSHMQDRMRRYIENRIEGGSFLHAVLCNDLMDALARADSTNRAALPLFCQFLYMNAPPACYGSREKVHAWLAGAQS